MRNVKPRELTMKSFHPYGNFAKMVDPAPRGIIIGERPIEFFRDMVPLRTGVHGVLMFSVNRVAKRPMVIDVSEYHNYCGEGMLPLDGDILMHVGPATPGGEVPLDDIEVFRVPKGTFVALDPAIWHHASFPYQCDEVNVLVVLPERTYENDCHVVQLKESDHIKIIENS